MKIQPIVEGHGDVEAVPVLLRRLADDAQAWEVRVGRSIRRNRSQLVEEPAFGTLVRAMGVDLSPWPPAVWGGS